MRKQGNSSVNKAVLAFVKAARRADRLTGTSLPDWSTGNALNETIRKLHDAYVETLMQIYRQAEWCGIAADPVDPDIRESDYYALDIDIEHLPDPDAVSWEEWRREHSTHYHNISLSGGK